MYAIYLQSSYTVVALLDCIACVGLFHLESVFCMVGAAGGDLGGISGGKAHFTCGSFRRA